MPSSRPRHIPRRSCVSCRTVRVQSTLLRITLDAAGNLAVNARRPRGRSAYCCEASACLETALRRHAIARALRQERLEIAPGDLRQAVVAVRQGFTEPPAR